MYGFPKPDKPDEGVTTYTRESKKHMKWSCNSPPSPPRNEAKSNGANPLLALFYAFCGSVNSDKSCLLTSNLTSMGKTGFTTDMSARMSCRQANRNMWTYKRGASVPKRFGKLSVCYYYQVNFGCLRASTVRCTLLAYTQFLSPFSKP